MSKLHWNDNSLKFQSRRRNADNQWGEYRIPTGRKETMEKIVYQVTAPDGEEWETPDFDIAKKALEKGCNVVVHKEITSYNYKTVVRVYISTELSLTDLEQDQ